MKTGVRFNATLSRYQKLYEGFGVNSIEEMNLVNTNNISMSYDKEIRE